MVTKKYMTVVAIHSAAAHLMNLINLFLLATASHYTIDFTYGILLNKLLVYESHPWFEALDLLFALFLTGITACVIISQGYVKKDEEKGIYLAIGTDIAIVLWSILYPFLSLLITGIVSPMLTFCIIQILVYIAISIFTSVYFLKASYII